MLTENLSASMCLPPLSGEGNGHKYGMRQEKPGPGMGDRGEKMGKRSQREVGGESIHTHPSFSERGPFIELIGHCKPMSSVVGLGSW